VQDGNALSAYILPNTSAGSITITVTPSASMDMWLNVFEYSKTAVSPLDGTAFAVSSIWQPTSFSSPSFTTTTASDTLWSYCLAPGGYTLTAGTAPVAWIALPSQTTGYATLIEDAPTTSAGSYYGECGTGSGAAIPEIITLALKPPTVLPQTITFPAIANQYALTSVGLAATASSGLTVSYASTTPSVCTVSGAMASLLISGSCTIEATQAGNSGYTAAPAVYRAFWVNPAHQTISFPAIASQTVLTSVSLSAAASSGLAVSFALCLHRRGRNGLAARHRNLHHSGVAGGQHHLWRRASGQHELHGGWQCANHHLPVYRQPICADQRRPYGHSLFRPGGQLCLHHAQRLHGVGRNGLATDQRQLHH
jgi:hypothetical protein